MNNKYRFAALIVAAGHGSRFKGDLPKQYQPLLGLPLVKHCIKKINQHIDKNNVYCAISSDHLSLYASLGDEMPQAVKGGASRQESVLRGLEALAVNCKPDFVLIHDAARPCLSSSLLEKLCAAAVLSGAAIPALPVTDTIKRADGPRLKTENRDKLYTVQTPQVFRFDKILELHRKYRQTAVTDDAALFELAGLPLTLVEGERTNIKVTYPEDLRQAEAWLAGARDDIRTGKGYDVHRLVTPKNSARKLIIGGVEIPHDKVLEGHSDADVGLHAVTDALLATICAGDIGMHFSPKDARWKDCDSSHFLHHAGNLVTAQDGVITHIDLTIICEEPKIGPHRDKIRTRIGEILSLPASRVSVKATTTEGLGFTGRREGIAAEAVATVRLPFITPATKTEQEHVETDRKAETRPASAAA